MAALEKFAETPDIVQEFQLFVHFTVDPAELDSVVDALLAGHSSTSLVYDPDQTERKEFLPMSWWTPSSISNGQHRVGENPPIYIWTDTDKHTVFVCTTD